MTARSTFSPRYASAVSLRLWSTMAEISGGVNGLESISTFTSSSAPPTIRYGTSFSSCATSECRRPMNRLIEYTVRTGLVTACRLAVMPTRRSLPVNATTDGVSRLPSALAITWGSDPSMMATTEFVVPRSIPMIFDIGTSLAGRGSPCEPRSTGLSS